MQNFKSQYIITVLIAIFCFSCGNVRKTSFNAPKDGLIAMDDVVEVKYGEAIALKQSEIKQIEVQQAGYKTEYGVWYRNKVNFWPAFEFVVIPLSFGSYSHFVMEEGFGFGLAMSWSVLLTGVFDVAHGPISELKWKYDLVKLPYYSSVESKVQIIDVEHCPGAEQFIDSTDYWMSSFCELIGIKNDDELDISGYNDFQIYSNIQSYNMMYTKMRRSGGHYYKELGLTVNYKIVNKFGEQVIDTTITAQSGKFLMSISDKFSYRDALDFSMIYLLSNPNVRSTIEKPQSKVTNSHYMEPSNEVISMDYDVYDELIYKVSTEFGLVPLLPIAKNGIAVLSHHAYDLAEDSLIIISPQGDTLKEYEVLEESFLHDYVVIKMNINFDQFFTTDFSSKVEADEMDRFEIVSVGFNQYIDVLNFVEGKVNALRYEDEYSMYQLDINASDLLYPAIFSKTGHLLGFISRTVDTRTVEGISFFRPLISE